MDDPRLAGARFVWRPLLSACRPVFGRVGRTPPSRGSDPFEHQQPAHVVGKKPWSSGENHVKHVPMLWRSRWLSPSLTQFRFAAESFVSREAVEQCVDVGVFGRARLYPASGTPPSSIHPAAPATA